MTYEQYWIVALVVYSVATTVALAAWRHLAKEWEKTAKRWTENSNGWSELYYKEKERFDSFLKKETEKR